MLLMYHAEHHKNVLQTKVNQHLGKYSSRSTNLRQTSHDLHVEFSVTPGYVGAVSFPCPWRCFCIRTLTWLRKVISDRCRSSICCWQSQFASSVNSYVGCDDIIATKHATTMQISATFILQKEYKQEMISKRNLGAVLKIFRGIMLPNRGAEKAPMASTDGGRMKGPSGEG